MKTKKLILIIISLISVCLILLVIGYFFLYKNAFDGTFSHTYFPLGILIFSFFTLLESLFQVRCRLEGPYSEITESH